MSIRSASLLARRALAVKPASMGFMHTAATQKISPSVATLSKLSLSYSTTSILSAGVGTKPTIAEAKECPGEFCEMDNTMIIKLSAEGIYEAIEERLIRDIMAKDEVDWDEAHVVFKSIANANTSGKSIQTLPQKLGVVTALGAGVAAIPMCFDRSTVLWFNDAWVTMELPEAHEISSTLEIGSWSWNWMEPPLGLASFVLLSLQFARAQLDNLGIKPYTGWMKSSRANGLVNQFPQYNPNILRDFSHAQPF